MQLSPHKVKFAIINMFIICAWHVKVESLRWQKWINTCCPGFGQQRRCFELHHFAPKLVHVCIYGKVDKPAKNRWLTSFLMAADKFASLFCVSSMSSFDVTTGQQGTEESDKKPATTFLQLLLQSLFQTSRGPSNAHALLEKRWMEKYYMPTSRNSTCIAAFLPGCVDITADQS